MDRTSSSEVLEFRQHSFTLATQYSIVKFPSSPLLTSSGWDQLDSLEIDCRLEPRELPKGPSWPPNIGRWDPTHQRHHQQLGVSPTLVPEASLLPSPPMLTPKPAFQDSVSSRASRASSAPPRRRRQTREWILGTCARVVHWACASGPRARPVEDSGSARLRSQPPAASLAAL